MKEMKLIFDNTTSGRNDSDHAECVYASLAAVCCF